MQRRMAVTKEITDPKRLVALRRNNNPKNEPIGHYTGRCGKCASKDLWDDYSFYGCNCCGAMFAVGDMFPMLVPIKKGRK